MYYGAMHKACASYGPCTGIQYYINIDISIFFFISSGAYRYRTVYTCTYTRVRTRVHCVIHVYPWVCHIAIASRHAIEILQYQYMYLGALCQSILIIACYRGTLLSSTLVYCNTAIIEYRYQHGHTRVRKTKQKNQSDSTQLCTISKTTSARCQDHCVVVP